MAEGTGLSTKDETGFGLIDGGPDEVAEGEEVMALSIGDLTAAVRAERGD